MREVCMAACSHVRGCGRTVDGQPIGSTTDDTNGGPSNTGLTVRCTPSRTHHPITLSLITHHPHPSLITHHTPRLRHRRELTLY